MESISQKLKRNLREGTFFKNVPRTLRRRLAKKIKVSNLLYFLKEERVMTKNYQKGIKKIASNYYKAGNYFLDSRVPITKDSIVYSLGILTDISFDLHLQENFGCDVYMYDPTPAAITYMKKFSSNKALKFDPIGVWTENTTLRFYEPELGGSSTIMEYGKTSKYFDAKCLTMETIMRQNQHTEIAVFKADIEGAALPILNQMLANNVFPDQIVAEFEAPMEGKEKAQEFLDSLSALRSNLKEAGYEEYLLPREEGKYFSLEMLFVKKDKIQ